MSGRPKVPELVAERYVGTFYVGVRDGEPIVRDVSDPEGDCKSMELYPAAEDALGRFYNVRRVRLYVDDEPVRAPESWGGINGGN